MYDHSTVVKCLGMFALDQLSKHPKEGKDKRKKWSLTTVLPCRELIVPNEVRAIVVYPIPSQSTESEPKRLDSDEFC